MARVNLEHKVFLAAIEFYQARAEQVATKAALGEHRNPALAMQNGVWCEKDGVASDRNQYDLNYTPECFRTQQPEAEWCGWCQEHGRIWKARQRAARRAAVALTKLKRVCKQAVEAQPA